MQTHVRAALLALWSEVLKTQLSAQKRGGLRWIALTPTADVGDKAAESLDATLLGLELRFMVLCNSERLSAFTA